MPGDLCPSPGGVVLVRFSCFLVRFGVWTDPSGLHFGVIFGCGGSLGVVWAHSGLYFGVNFCSLGLSEPTLGSILLKDENKMNILVLFSVPRGSSAL